MREDCIFWDGRLNHHGYPIAATSDDSPYATGTVHRQVAEEAHGPIPRGWQVHHLCESKLCVEPSHLLPCTPRDHMRHHGAGSGKWWFKRARAGSGRRTYPLRPPTV